MDAWVVSLMTTFNASYFCLALFSVSASAASPVSRYAFSASFSSFLASTSSVDSLPCCSTKAFSRVW